MTTDLEDSIVDLTDDNDRQDWLLDQALEETFPASDPISPVCPLSQAW